MEKLTGKFKKKKVEVNALGITAESLGSEDFKTELTSNTRMWLEECTLERGGYIKLPPRKVKPLNPFLKPKVPKKIELDLRKKGGL